MNGGCLKSQDSLFFIRVGIGELFSNTQIMEGLKYFLDALFFFCVSASGVTTLIVFVPCLCSRMLSQLGISSIEVLAEGIPCTSITGID